MVTFYKYNKEISSEDWSLYLRKIKNDIFKLLPLREENSYWEKHLSTVLIEFSGINSLVEYNSKIISIMGKLEGLKYCENFFEYRKTIFEILSLLDKLEEV